MKIALIASLSVILVGSAVSARAQGIPTTSGWFEIPNTKLRSICPPDNFGGEAYQFSYYCQNIPNSWSSGLMDTLRNRLIIWGGGHTSYYGNELYSVDLNDLTIHRINDPSIPTNYHGGTNSCITTLADGTP